MAGITLSNLPFEVGQCVEVKSFLAGFRGAWFRSKIKGFRRKSKHLGVDLEYIDFPDGKIKWTKLYQKYNRRRHLMIRPCFPPIYRDCQQPDIKTTNEVVVFVKDTWEVGDWVDWWANECYWSGRLTEKLGHEKFQLKLWPSPEGEGLTYEACSKDFRPSLNWSVEREWKVPAPQEGGNFHPCARLILPMEVCAVDKDQKEAQAAPGAVSHSSQNLMDPIPELPNGERSSILISSEIQTLEHETNLNVMHGDGGISRATATDGIPGLHVKGASGDKTENADASDDHPPKKRRSETNLSIDPVTMCGGICRATFSDGIASLNVKGASDDMEENVDSSDNRPPKKMRSQTNISIDPNTMEPAIVDLEELVNRIKWIKSILKPSPNSVQLPWEFIDHSVPPTLK